MITYINSGNDAKRFNTFALAAKHSLIKKQQAINAQIDYLKSVYNSYVSHYNQLQKLIKEVNDLTGESRYTKVDYSDFPAVDISASFSIKLHNVRLVPEGTSSLRFKNTIEDLRNNFSDLSLSIKSVYNRVMTELSPYGSMRQRTDNIREESSKASAVVGININTALTEGDLSEEDWSNIKELANEKRDDTEKSMSSAKSESESEEAEKAAREAAEKAFNEEQNRLDKAFKDAQNRFGKATDEMNKFGNGFYDSVYVTDKNGVVTYTDPRTGEIFVYSSDKNPGISSKDSYTDEYGLTTSVDYNPDTNQWTVTKKDGIVETYNNEDDANAAANEDVGKDIFSSEGGIRDAAEDAYNSSHQLAIADKNAALEELEKTGRAAEEHRNSGSSNDSSGGT